MSDSSASVHQPQNKQAIIRGAKNWDYKASGEPGTLSAGQHCRTKSQKLHESMKNSKFPSFQSASAAERSHPGSIFPPDAMFPSGFRTLISSTTLLNSGLFLPRALQFLAFKTTACILLRTTTKVTMFETQGNKHKLLANNLWVGFHVFLMSSTMWINSRCNFPGNPVTSPCKLGSTTRRFETTIIQCHVRSFCFYPPQAFLARGEGKIQSRRKDSRGYFACLCPAMEDSLCWTGKNPATRFPGFLSPQSCTVTGVKMCARR